MNNLYVSDTHALVWFLQDSPMLGCNARAILESEGRRLLLPAIALAEACWMVEKGTYSIDSYEDLFDTLADDSSIEIDPLDGEIVRLAASLTTIPEMHDRQIVASALRAANGNDTSVKVITADRRITESGAVEVVW